MASNGAGVSLDASVPPQRITWYDKTHADFQDDGLGHDSMDLHKVWSCMGRAGVNGVTRLGLIEEGDPFNGWPACWIEEVTGGVAGGVSRWDTVTGYCPHGGVNAGDFTVFSSLAPHDGIAFHIYLALAAQPDIVVEFCTSASPAPFGTWAAHTVTRTPDFTLANGKNLQRLEVTPQATWAAVQLAGLAAPGAYYHSRIRLNTGTGGPFALSNYNYKDWLYGYFKHFYSHYDLKKGDDLTGGTETSFRMIGFFGIRFRPGYSWASRNLLGDTQLGDQDTTGRTPRPRSGWYSVSTKPPVITAAKLYGGLITGRARYPGETPTLSIRSSASEGRIIGCNVIGWSGSYAFGGAGATPLAYIDGLRATPDDERIGSFAQVMTNFALTQSGYSRGIVVDIPHGKGFLSGLRNAIASPTIAGIRFTDDDVSQAQMVLTGAGYKNLFDIEWGGADRKLDGTLSGTSNGRDWRRLDLTIWNNDATQTHPPAGIPYRITDDVAALQRIGTFDANGYDSGLNSLPSAPTVGEIARNIIAASEWESSTELVLDTYLTIEINPEDLPGYDSDYATLILTGRMDRALGYDISGGVYAILDYQPAASHIHVALPLASQGGGGPSPPFTYDQAPIEVGAERILVDLPKMTLEGGK